MGEVRKCGCGKGKKAPSIIPDSTPTNKRCITSEKAPQPVGPYSQAVVIDNTVYISGCLGLKVPDNTLIEGGAAVEAKLALKNLGAILEASGSSYNNVLKTTVFLEDMEDFTAVNQVYQQFFSKEYPARSCVQVAKLPLGAKFEIEAVATLAPAGSGPTGSEGGPPVKGTSASAVPADVPPAEAPPADAPPAEAPPADAAPMAEEVPAEDAPPAEEAPPAAEEPPAAEGEEPPPA